ncbi:MAG TPA: hypothetical protein VLB46_11865 [Pyrinomonadaceae bacterium]|nr:hypothetical protein [Pyrinomonadaceae bacterium]
MAKTYVQDSNLEASATGIAAGLGLPSRSARKVIEKFQVREIADDEEVFCFTAKGRYMPLKVGKALLSALDVSRETGLSLGATKSFLRQPYGWHVPNGIYSCVLKGNWKFQEG